MPRSEPRFSILDMMPMTFYESGDSSGSVSLGELFGAPESISGASQADIRDIAFLICRGGWPDAVAEELSREAALDQARDYVDLVSEEDISRVDGVERNVERVRALLCFYARYQGSQTSVSQICADIRANDRDTLSDDTVSAYLSALRQIFVVSDLASWNPNLRSKAAIRTSNTRYFSDPSIAAAALRIGPEDLTADLQTMGLLFETPCVRDLRVYASTLDGDLHHYRDSNGLECDAVVHLRNGRYGLVEIKLGGDRIIDEGSRTLNKLAEVIDTARMGAPAFKMILTAVGSMAYRRPDGIYVVQVTCLIN